MVEIARALRQPGLGARVGRDAATPMGLLVLRLSRAARLTPAEIDQITALAGTRKRWRPGAVLLAEGRGAGPHFVLSGWACSQRLLRDGRRQIHDFIVPGEGFGLRPVDRPMPRESVMALTPLETVEAGALVEAARAAANGGLWRAIRTLLLDEDARRLDHIVRLGRLTAYEKTAHFVLEMRRRAGAGEALSFPLPLTQEIMADALGLSVVHLNRVLRQLRAAQLLEIRGGVAVIGDAKALAAAAVLPVGDDPPAANA